MFSKLTYAIIKKCEIKLCISVHIYSRPPKLGMSTHFFTNLADGMNKNMK